MGVSRHSGYTVSCDGGCEELVVDAGAECDTRKEAMAAFRGAEGVFRKGRALCASCKEGGAR